MVSSLQTRIKNLSGKLQLLADRYEELKENNRRLEERNAELADANQQLSERLAKARMDVEYLTMSHHLADTPEHLVEARRKIAAMIREVDRCISKLKE